MGKFLIIIGIPSDFLYYAGMIIYDLFIKKEDSSKSWMILKFFVKYITTRK